MPPSTTASSSDPAGGAYGQTALPGGIAAGERGPFFPAPRAGPGYGPGKALRAAQPGGGAAGAYSFGGMILAVPSTTQVLSWSVQTVRSTALFLAGSSCSTVTVAVMVSPMRTGARKDSSCPT